MALTFFPDSLVIESDSSILDLPAFHAAVRDWEDSGQAMVFPVTHTWKALDLGGGSFFYQLDLINGWRLRFSTAGNYTIEGNLKGEIVPVAGVYVERRTSAAYSTTAIGGSGPTPEQISVAVWSRILEAGLSAEAIQRLMLAGMAGRTTGLGTDHEEYLGQNGEVRIAADFDATSNRIAVELDGD